MSPDDASLLRQLAVAADASCVPLVVEWKSTNISLKALAVLPCSPPSSLPMTTPSSSTHSLHLCTLLQSLVVFVSKLFRVFSFLLLFFPCHAWFFLCTLPPNGLLPGMWLLFCRYSSLLKYFLLPLEKRFLQDLHGIFRSLDFDFSTHMHSVVLRHR